MLCVYLPSLHDASEPQQTPPRVASSAPARASSSSTCGFFVTRVFYLKLRKAPRPLVQGSNDVEGHILNTSASKHTDLTRCS